MRCPYCGHVEDKVLESRQNSSATSIRRRRECLECGYRFTSYERIEEKPLMVVKRDGRREPFDITKISGGWNVPWRRDRSPARSGRNCSRRLKMKRHERQGFP